MKTRRQPTEAQKAAAKERRTKMREIAKRIKLLTEPEKIALLQRAGIRTVTGEALSDHNTMMILFQSGLQDVPTLIGGFRQWKAHGRRVMKGQHGYAIWCPTFYGAAGTDGSAEEQAEHEEAGLRGFVLGTVFDISQTEEIGAPATANAADDQHATMLQAAMQTGHLEIINC